MTAHLDGFDRIARIYDSLKRVVFGNALYQSEVNFLESIGTPANILIIGGGSGEILPLLQEMRPEATIWFVEASSKMLHMAIGRLAPEQRSRVQFVHGTERSLPEGLLFDSVITNFFLDLFSERKLAEICNVITRHLRPDGLWLVTDFVNSGKGWQSMLLWLMYRFFAATCSIEARGLPAWQERLRLSGMEEIAFRPFYGGFIRSAVYRSRSTAS